MASPAPLLSVLDLTIRFGTDAAPAVDGVSFDIQENEVFALVGESGAGKTLTGRALLGLLPRRAAVGGRVVFRGRSLLDLAEKEMCGLRGERIAMVPQDALAGLNPVLSLGRQIAEAFVVHDHTVSKGRIVELLDVVGIPEPALRARQYPHELSGGMRQRALIAMALANDPDVLVLDEPTTALDVTIQAQVMDVIRRLRERTKCAVVLITHDLAVVAGLADRVAVMYAGRLVETADVDTLFYRSAHPYTRGLLSSLPGADHEVGQTGFVGVDGHSLSPNTRPMGCAFHPRCPLAELPDPCASEVPTLRPIGNAEHASACHRAELVGAIVPTAYRAAHKRPPPGETLLDVQDLVKDFSLRPGLFGRHRGETHAVRGVSLTLARAETLGLVGESGCGKSTMARMVLNLLPATSGSVHFRGQNVLTAAPKEMRALRRRLQIVFQDSYASLNPRVPIGRIIAGPLRAHGLYGPGGPIRVAELMEMTGLDPADADRYPHELSGGQRQRVGIARALATCPEVVVLDEPVSALDASIRAGIVNLLRDLQGRLGVAYLLIAHDLSMLRDIADRVAVMYLGRIVEIGTVADIYGSPAHPYTQALLSAVPLPDPRRERVRQRILLTEAVPDAIAPLLGCRFRAQCWKATALCAEQDPPLIERGRGHPVACHFAEPPSATHHP